MSRFRSGGGITARSKRFHAALVSVAVMIGGAGACKGKHQGPGEVTGERIPQAVVAERTDARDGAARTVAREADVAVPDKEILFGDLHVHTTFSPDAFMWSLPIMQGEGAHPVADACDFARYCAELDFWSINDHAEGLTPRRWRETKETIRRCNEVAGDESDPDVVAFLGWEWTQIGRTPEEHYGHKNVIFRETAEDRVPARPIHSDSYAFQAARDPLPWWREVALPLLDWPNREYDRDLFFFQEELRAVPECAEGVDTRELPDECLEGATTPKVLFEKLAQWGFDVQVIPHGTTWGIYTPPGANWAKQIGTDQNDEEYQRVVEVFSGHGNSEEYRPWRSVEIDGNGNKSCPEPTADFEPCCWRAGEIIRERCEDAASPQCESRVEQARRHYLEASGVSGRFAIPGVTVEDWKDCGTCRSCFNPSMKYRPGGSVQYMLAAKSAGDGDPLHFGFIASSDNHRGRPGTGYKEHARLAMADAFGPESQTAYDRLTAFAKEEPEQEAVPVDAERLKGLAQFQMLDFERQASYFMTGGLVAVHSEGRSRDEIWDAVERREVYGTSGDRILLWFDMVGDGGARVPMGSMVEASGTPKFKVRAVGAREQLPGCPDFAADGLSPERLEKLCLGECYNPGDGRKLISRIEVVRIKRQQSDEEKIEDLIEDPWKVIECAPDPAGCVVEFEDESFASDDRETIYYVRALEPASPAVNAANVRCRPDGSGGCESVDPCYGDYRTPADDDCLSMNEERAWSSPIYVRRAGG
jgi:hypothetical protein